MARSILHSDLNNFYASVECLYNPALRNKPVAVCGDTEARHGIVLAKNDLAKTCGIRTGHVIWQAKQLCPELTIVPPHYDRYLAFSRYVTDIYREYTNRVEHFGLDECWMDVSETSHLFGSAEQIAETIRQTIKDHLKITVSIGVSYNKVFAKLGSDMQKPDAITVITKDNFRQLVWPLPASDLLYVGPATTKKLFRRGIHTIGQLANMDVGVLNSLFGVIGEMLWLFANGKDATTVRDFDENSLIKSIGNSTTCPRDLITDDDVRITLYLLCESVAQRLRDHHFLSRTVSIWMRDCNLCSITRQETIQTPTNLSTQLFETAFSLYRRNHIIGRPIRSLGVRASNLVSDHVVQTSFLPEFLDDWKTQALERTIDALRNCYGHGCIKRAVMLSDRSLSAVNPREDHIIHPVGFLR